MVETDATHNVLSTTEHKHGTMPGYSISSPGELKRATMFYLKKTFSMNSVEGHQYLGDTLHRNDKHL